MNKLIAMGSLALAFGVGTWTGYSVAPAVEVPAAAARNPLPALVDRDRSLAEGRADVDSSALRALVRQEMDAALAAHARSNPAAAVATTKAPADVGAVTPETQAKRREAVEQIESVLTQGTWGNAQRFTFQQNLVMLDSEQKEKALQQLTTAINSGTLQVSTDGPPL